MLRDAIRYSPKWKIRRFADERAFLADRPDFVYDPVTGLLLPPEVEFDGNLLLNEGIGDLLLLLTGGGGTAFSNANAYLGVGDSATAAAAAQTGLQAATNKTYKAMSSTYPQISGQTLTFRAAFGSAEGNHGWQEFTAASGNSDAAVNLNRKVSDQGTKTAGQTWTLDLAITFS